MGQFDGKVAIVMGAARGLGRAYAKGLLGLGPSWWSPTSICAPTRKFEAEAKDMTADSTVAEIEAADGTRLRD
jgi:NAD(P)-dependent dehydrogenase (short-subunit alcohol dehydrogenase family)